MATARKLGIFVVMVGWLLGLTPGHVQARVDASRGEKIYDIPLGSAQTLRVPYNLEKMVVSDPPIVDVVPVSPGQILLVAKTAGETQVTVWARGGLVQTFRVTASLPVAALQRALNEALPTEDDITVRSSGGAIYLTGKVSDLIAVESASKIAKNMFAGTSRKVTDVVNLLSVTAPQQVQVHMRFVEITRTHMRNMGFNEWASNKETSQALFGPNDPFHYCLTCDTQRFLGPINTAVPADTSGLQPGLPVLTSPIGGSFALSFATTKILPLTATLALLENRGVAKTLSEPTLVAMSGQEAKFLVGGEFPIPIPDALGRVTVTFKKYGAQVGFIPTVLAQDTVNLAVSAEVSQLDQTNSVRLGSTQVPALSSRQSSTSVRMRDGQSFAIAGLLSDTITNSVAKMPLLGEIPVLGAFFRNVRAQRQETELMVLISVNLVKPLEPNEVPPVLRNEDFNDASDIQLFLLGNIDRPTSPQPPTAKGRAGSSGSAATQSSPEGAVGFSR